MAEPGLTQVVDVVLGRKTASDIAREQVAGLVKPEDYWKAALGATGTIILIGALLWIGASLAEGAYGYLKR